MKHYILGMLSIAVLAGCASNSKVAPVEAEPISAINTQRLATNFKRQGIKLEWDCAFGLSMIEATCNKGDIKAIEATGYAPSFGNSQANIQTAFDVAHDEALDKLSRFIRQDINSSRVTHTISKNVEKANDRIKNRIKADDEVAMSDDEAAKDTNFAIRENTNDTVRTVTNSIRTQTASILRGVVVKEEKVVDRQTVAVTIRWDSVNERAVNNLRKRMAN
jgi:hypothetical protein|tara:strand:+ start:4430 stop:5089 length:660 start_codon:yes stop_codon:yes gene_type:complete